jgi:transcription-repair coupling factor (superfamily II helicase)
LSASWLAVLEPVLSEARARLAAAQAPLAITGPGGTARLLLPVCLGTPPLLVVVPREREVEPATADIETLAFEAGIAGAVLAFPAPGPGPFRGLPRHPDACLRRAAALHAAHRGRLAALVASPAGLLRPVLRRRSFETAVVELVQGEEMTPELLLEALDESGYRREDPVTAPGEMARRGGILDVFPPDRERPVRLEFFGDVIESLREFDPDTQRSGARLERIELVPLSDVFATRSLAAALGERILQRWPGSRPAAAWIERLLRGQPPEDLPELLGLVEGALVPAWEHLPGAFLAVVEPAALAAEAEALFGRAAEDRAGVDQATPAPTPAEALVEPAALQRRLAAAPGLTLGELETPAGADRPLSLRSRAVPRYAGDVRRLTAELRGAPGHTAIYLGTPGRAERLAEVLAEDGVATGEGAAVELHVGHLSAGFELPEVGLRVLADGDVFPEEVHLHGRRRGRTTRFVSDFRDLEVGDLVVHQDHGIGRYEGLETLALGGSTRELMVLSYLGGDKLKVPIESFDRVQKYVFTEGTRPRLDRLGSGSWDKVKTRVKKAMREMAAELLRLYAARKARPGHAFSGDSPWLREFEASFDFEETPDQAAAIADVAADMQRSTPMDRLICGDVGYGKTEVAMRAAMRAVLDGKQVAVLTPTTVLAFQHWKTFRTRYAPFPVRVEMVSRFRTAKQIHGVVADLAAGRVDVLIGTHRLLSKDVQFRDLGLLVIDEEQRFGVAAKERLKQLRQSVDCLTLSATPIPRTLQMGLTGIRDMSVIETPPRDRLAIQTSIVRFSTETIATAIRQELSRDGQVYFVHNRVESIDSLAAMVQRLVPEARVAVAHGQMPEARLERTMLGFVEGRSDVLVCTTIIENGLDIPRANTLLVNRADRYGLAQLYQLRGRVGRSDRRAHAWLLVPPDTVLSEVAQKRLAAIRDFSDLGAGFRIAALDLELRGAGNLLGGQQSGHIHAVGLDLYVKLLEQAVHELQAGEEAGEPAGSRFDLRVELRVPAEYIPDLHQRLALYKRVSQLRTLEELDGLGGEVRDRYGPPPVDVARLLLYARLRLEAERLGVSSVERRSGALRLQLRGASSPQALVAFVGPRPGSSLSPDGVLIQRLDGAEPLDALADLLAGLAGTSGGASYNREIPP